MKEEIDDEKNSFTKMYFPLNDYIVVMGPL